MKTSSDDAARQEDRCRQQGSSRSDARSNQIQSHEDEGDDRGSEDFKESFDPQMNDPPAPVFNHRQMRMLSPCQSRTIEQSNGTRSDGQQRHKLLLLALLS